MRPSLGIHCSMKDCRGYATSYVLIGVDGQEPEEIPVCERCRKQMATLLEIGNDADRT